MLNDQKVLAACLGLWDTEILDNCKAIVHCLKAVVYNEFLYKKRVGIFLMINIILSIIATAFLISFAMPVVSAEIWSCCRETKDGAICQDSSLLGTENCKSSLIPGSCERDEECKIGCCIDEEEGLCTPNSPKTKCTEGIWNDEESCAIAECEKGCCVLGNNAQFVTNTRCEQISGFYGFEKDFRDVDNEIDCLSLAASQFEGACVFEEKCNRKTESECLSEGGKFYKDYLCSHPELKTSCEKQSSVSCLEGKDEIYWFDSCGNMENIYNSDKKNSWNDGKILKKEDSCNADSGNIDSENCGNCNYFLGSKCSESEFGDKKIKDGGYICKDVRCKDENGKTWQNGESWCAYDSFIGDGKDTVGSRHWKRMCINGEIKIEGCADYRGAICAESEIKEGIKSFSMASCILNEAAECLNYNSDENMEQECEENEQCIIKKIDVDDFQFDVCVGKYPLGFNLEETGNGKEICSLASQTCIVIYEKKIGGWECIANCECEEKTFTEQMNDLCISLGDCGSYINYIGKGTDNIEVENAPEISWKDYKKYAIAVPGQGIETQGIEKFLSFFRGGSLNVGRGSNENDFNEILMMVGAISGATGGIIAGASWAFGTTSGVYGIHGLDYTIGAFGTSAIPAPVAAFGTVLASAGIGMALGNLLAGVLGLSGQGATLMSVGGGIAGTGAGLMIIGKGGAFGPWGIAIGVGIIAVTAIAGIGKTKEVKVEFTCMPWQAPIGGADCKKCNDNLLKPCTKYRCESLGSACKLLNENTENPICEGIRNDNRPPVISIGYISEGYAFNKQETKRVEIRKENGDCIPEFSKVDFVLKTDEFAQCKFDFQRTNNYEEMSHLNQNVFVENHSFSFAMPSLDSLSVYDIQGDIREMFGNLNMYVRCQDANGNANLDEYIVNFCINSGPDLTPAIITSYKPEDGGYLKYGTNETPTTIYLNEPAECRYDILENESYESMKNIMQCKTEITDVELQGWPCSTTLTNLNAGENNFYIKCKDQPWLKINISRNTNAEDFLYTLYVSENELKIDSITPKGIIKAGFEPASVDLEVKTSGGVDNGVAVCYYAESENAIMSRFYETFSNKHKQNFNTLTSGDYNIYVKCEDEAGNIVSGDTSFSLEIDSGAPIVVRSYNEESKLKIITNEEAKCYYSFDRCGFELENGTSMSIGFSKEHNADWKAGVTYYIKCKDIWDNINPWCAVILKSLR